MTTVQCPICGSENLRTTNETLSAQLTLGPDFEYSAKIYECGECGEKGDFTGENDKQYDLALSAAQKELQKRLIDEIGEQGLTMAYVERALELPQRTIARWKNGDSSASGLALLRIVKSMPWIVDVADNKYEQAYLAGKMCSVIAEKLTSHVVDINYSESNMIDVTPESSKLHLDNVRPLPNILTPLYRVSTDDIDVVAMG